MYVYTKEETLFVKAFGYVFGFYQSIHVHICIYFKNCTDVDFLQIYMKCLLCFCYCYHLLFVSLYKTHWKAFAMDFTFFIPAH